MSFLKLIDRNIERWALLVFYTMLVVTMAVEHFNRISRLLQKGVPVRIAFRLRSTFFDDDLMEAMLEETVTEEMIHAAVRKGVLACELTPVYVGSAYKNKGVQKLLDAIVEHGARRAEQISLHHDRRLSGMLDVVSVSPRTAWEVMLESYRPHLNSIEQRLALRETVSHLEHLRTRDQVTSFPEGELWFYRRSAS